MGFDETFDPIASLIDNSQIYDHNAKLIVHFIVSYYQEMHAIEKAQHQLTTSMISEENHRIAISEQYEVFKKYWNPKDEYWEPCSIGGEDQHDPTAISSISVLADGRGGFIVNLDYQNKNNVMGNGPIAFRIETFNQKPKIVNKYF